MKIISLKVISDFFTRHNYLNYAFLFLIAFGLFFYLQSTLTFADPDSFYHARMAVLTKDQGIVKNFPWAEFTILKNNFADHHYLYHVALVPFVAWLDPLIGLKLATIFFDAIFIVFFYWFLRKNKIKWAFLWPFLLLISNPFMFRIGLAKAQAFSLIILILGLDFIFRQKYFWLFILSFFYVWTYGGWPIMLVLALAYIFVSWVIEIIKLPKKSFFLAMKKLLSPLNLKLFFVVLGGLLAGLVINPFFPQNLYFYYEQIFKIALVNYQGVIRVGAEWYPYRLTDLWAAVSLVWVFIIIGFVLLAINLKKQSIRSWTLLLLATLFFFLTLKSRRNVEYFIPFTILFLAFSFSDSLQGLDLKGEIKKLYNYFKFKRWRIVLGFVIIVYFLITIPTIIYRDLSNAKNDNRNGLAFDKFEKASQWLMKNAKPGEIVFMNDWDEFPELFYHNPSNYYIVGLDPTFMYNYNPKLYQEWVNITTGDDKDNLYNKIKNDFHASYDFVSIARHGSADDNLKADKRFKLVYGDEEARIYQIK